MSELVNQIDRLFKTETSEENQELLRTILRELDTRTEVPDIVVSKKGKK